MREGYDMNFIQILYKCLGTSWGRHIPSYTAHILLQRRLWIACWMFIGYRLEDHHEVGACLQPFKV